MKKIMLGMACYISLLLACQPNSKPVNVPAKAALTDLKEQLPGAWESVSFKVTIHSANNADSTVVFEVAEENWQQQLGSRPILTSFYADNKYKRLFRNTGAIASDTLRGMWNVFGDTLMLIEPTTSYQYQVSVQANGLAEFRSLMDWDGDGQADDEFVGIERKVSKTPF